MSYPLVFFAAPYIVTSASYLQTGTDRSRRRLQPVFPKKHTIPTLSVVQKQPSNYTNSYNTVAIAFSENVRVQLWCKTIVHQGLSSLEFLKSYGALEVRSIAIPSIREVASFDTIEQWPKKRQEAAPTSLG